MNATYEFRTNSSMRNQDTWDYAQITCSKVWIIMGSIVLAVSLILCVITTKVSDIGMESLSIKITISQCILVVLNIIPVEFMIKRKFR